MNQAQDAKRYRFLRKHLRLNIVVFTDDDGVTTHDHWLVWRNGEAGYCFAEGPDVPKSIERLIDTAMERE